MVWLQRSVATFGARVVGNFEINQFCPEASAILALMAGMALEQPRLRRVPLPGTCMVAEGENCLELCCHSKLQINAAETFCRREIRDSGDSPSPLLWRGHFEILAKGPGNKR
jgi:hypothetical protein